MSRGCCLGAVWILTLSSAALACQRTPKESTENAGLAASSEAAPASLASAAAALPLSKQSTAQNLCLTVCERTKGLGCVRGNECQADCTELQDSPVCAKEMTAFLGCIAAEPASHFECDEGKAAIKFGHCDREQEAYAVCVEHAQGPT